MRGARLWLVWFGCTVFSAPLPAANFYALLIGINYVGADPSIPPLTGAVPDMQELYAVMTGSLSFPAHAIHTLQEQQATRRNIIHEIKQWLIANTKAGDRVFWSYSGHGVQVPDTLATYQFYPEE